MKEMISKMQKERIGLLREITLILSFFVFFAAGMVFASQDQEPEVKRKVVTKEIRGEVGGISNNFIAINYGQTDKELLQLGLKMDKSTRGSMRKLSEIKPGDIVSVTYEETVETQKGEQPRVIKRLAKVVEFRRAAPSAPSEGNVLESQ